LQIFLPWEPKKLRRLPLRRGGGVKFSDPVESPQDDDNIISPVKDSPDEQISTEDIMEETSHDAYKDNFPPIDLSMISNQSEMDTVNTLETVNTMNTMLKVNTKRDAFNALSKFVLSIRVKKCSNEEEKIRATKNFLLSISASEEEVKNAGGLLQETTQDINNFKLELGHEGTLLRQVQTHIKSQISVGRENDVPAFADFVDDYTHIDIKEILNYINTSPEDKRRTADKEEACTTEILTALREILDLSDVSSVINKIEIIQGRDAFVFYESRAPKKMKDLLEHTMTNARTQRTKKCLGTNLALQAWKDLSSSDKANTVIWKTFIRSLFTSALNLERKARTLDQMYAGDEEKVNDEPKSKKPRIEKDKQNRGSDKEERTNKERSPNPYDKKKDSAGETPKAGATSTRLLCNGCGLAGHSYDKCRRVFKNDEGHNPDRTKRWHESEAGKKCIKDNNFREVKIGGTTQKVMNVHVFPKKK